MTSFTQFVLDAKNLEFSGYLLDAENLKFFGYLVAISFLGVLVLGMSKIAVIYQDNSDFAWSTSVIVIPILSLLGLIFIAPDPVPDSFNILWEGGQQKFITIVGLIGTVSALFIMYKNSISANGFLVGTVVFLFKLIASLITDLVAIGICNKLFSKSRSVKMVIVTMIVFGLFSFILKHLINGDAVEQRRLARS